PADATSPISPLAVTRCCETVPNPGGAAEAALTANPPAFVKANPPAVTSADSTPTLLLPELSAVPLAAATIRSPDPEPATTAPVVSVTAPEVALRYTFAPDTVWASVRLPADATSPISPLAVTRCCETVPNPGGAAEAALTANPPAFVKANPPAVTSADSTPTLLVPELSAVPLAAATSRSPDPEPATTAPVVSVTAPVAALRYTFAPDTVWASVRLPADATSPISPLAATRCCETVPNP